MTTIKIIIIKKKITVVYNNNVSMDSTIDLSRVYQYSTRTTVIITVVGQTCVEELFCYCARVRGYPSGATFVLTTKQYVPIGVTENKTNGSPKSGLRTFY